MSDWFVPFKYNKNSYIRLFCFHYGGGSASAYREWAKDLIDYSPYAKTLFLRNFISSCIEAILAATNNLYLMAK